MEEIGRMNIAPMVYMVLLCELLEEKYGNEFIKMTSSVQEEMIMLVGNDFQHAAILVARKLNDPTFSMKGELMKKMSQGRMDS